MNKPTAFFAATALVLATMSPIVTFADNTFTASARVSEDAKIKETGLSVFPGATQVLKRDEGRSSPAALLDFAVGRFGFKLVVVTMRSDATTEAIAAFYRQDLARYGDVVDCSDPNAPTEIITVGDAVNCKPITKSRRKSTSRPDAEFRVGTKTNQRVVAIRQKDNGTEFALVHVNLNLPDWMKNSQISVTP